MAGDVYIVCFLNKQNAKLGLVEMEMAEKKNNLTKLNLDLLIDLIKRYVPSFMAVCVEAFYPKAELI